MKRKTLQDLAKFGAGLVLGDFLSLLWLSSHGILPINFLGITFTETIVLPGLIFDTVLFIFLIHYGWHIGKIPAIREKNYLLFAGTLFSLVAAVHFIRIFFHSTFVIFDWTVPVWLSWFGVAVTTFLAYSSFRLLAKK